MRVYMVKRLFYSMIETNKLHLKPSSILNVPIQSYSNDFTFIVNGDEFKTSRLVSDLLSTTISRIHSTDPTFDRYVIDTQQKGDFSRFLQLLNFEEKAISENEIGFISEVIKILGNDSFDIIECNQSNEVTVDNVFRLIKNHQQYEKFYSKSFQDEMDFISLHFFELIETNKEEIKALDMNTLLSIINSDKLQLRSEDQLLMFINELYSIDSKYSILFESVEFLNVSTKSIKEFIQIYDKEDMSQITWFKLCERLKEEINDDQSYEPITMKKRYKKENDKEVKEKKRRRNNHGQTISFADDNLFDGIINCLRTQSEKIEEEIDVTASSCYINTENNQPKNVVHYDNQNGRFHSKSEMNNWIKIDFKERRVVPTEYSIRTAKCYGVNGHHPKSWVIECSNDNERWEVLDEENNCSHLNGPSMVHTFKIKNQTPDEFRYIQIRQTGPDWAGSNFLVIESFEIYGQLIQ